MFTPEEERYIELVSSEATTSLAAIKEIWPNLKQPKSKHSSLSKSERIQDEITRRREINKYRVSYTQEDVIKSLWQEARDYDSKNQSARVQALVHLGKHIGMFENNKSETDNNYNFYVLNYGSDEKKGEIIEGSVVKEEPKKISQVDGGITITNYSQEKPEDD